MVNQEEKRAETSRGNVEDSLNIILDEKMKRKRQLRDKIVFTLNFSLLIVSIIAFVKSPLMFAYVNTVSITIMMIHRLYEFYCFKWQFYLTDFCYVVNTLVILYSTFFPESSYMFITAFAFATGPIFTSIAYYRMGFVFHNTVKMTSQWTHYSPALTMFLIRWYDTNGNFIGNDLTNSQLNFEFAYNFFSKCSLLYLTWFFIYYFLIFHLFKKYIEKKGCETQYNYLMSKSDSRKILMVFGNKWSEIVYMFTHVTWVYVNLALSLLQFFYFYLGAALIIYLTVVSIWNAASYYIDFFSLLYTRQFSEKDKESYTTPI